jgi:hypothetical protein
VPEKYLGNPLKTESTSNLKDDSRNERMGKFVALATELSESQESFPFPGIEPDMYSRMKATEMEFPDDTTPIDTLAGRFRAEGMRVFLGQYPQSGNVYIVPAGRSEAPNDDAYISPKHLQINEMMDEKTKRLILMDRAGFKSHP